MLKLCGFAASNYHNKVKFALLEKGVPFEEELAWVGQTDAAASPLGKVPYLKTEQGALCESAVMLEYIEQHYPQNPLLPADPFAAAKVRELALFLDLHLPLVSGATKLIYGKDFLAALPARDYLKMMGERPHMQTINADRKANMELMMSRMKAKP